MKLDNELIEQQEPLRAIEAPLGGIAHLDALAAPVINLGSQPPSSRTSNWTEVLGPDDGTHAVHLSQGSTPITDADSANLSWLSLSLPLNTVAQGDTLSYRFDDSVIDPDTIFALLPGGGTMDLQSFMFMWNVTDTATSRVILFQCTSGGGVAIPAPTFIFSELLRGLLFNNTSDAVVGNTSRPFKITVSDDTGLNSTTAQSTILVASVNEAPTLTTMSSAVVSATEDVPQTITFQNLAAAGNEADVDGTVTAFVVKSVASGTLMIVNSSGVLAAWNVNTNNRIDATHAAQWLADPNANGVLNAFKVVALDNSGAPSLSPVTVTVSVIPVADAPVVNLNLEPTHYFTEVLGPDTGADAVRLVTTVNPISDPDSANLSKIEIQLSAISGDQLCYRLQAQPTAADYGNFISVDAPGVGVLKVGSVYFLGTITDIGYGQLNLKLESLGADLWPAPAPVSVFNTLLSGLYFNNTSDAPDTTTIRAFYFTAFDDGGLASPQAYSIVNVTAVNELPTLTSFSGPIATVPEDTQGTFTYAQILAASDARDPDGPVRGFLVTSVPNGTLFLGNASGTILNPWSPGFSDIIDATTIVKWTGAPNQNGTIDAFAVRALDDFGKSATPVLVPIAVTPVNDAPTIQLGNISASVTHQFIEVVGPDTGANAVHLADSQGGLGDVDSVNLSKLQIVMSKTFGAPVAGDTIGFRQQDTVLEPSNLIPTHTTGTGLLTTADTTYRWTITDGGTFFTLAIESIDASGAPAPAPVWAYDGLLKGLLFNSSSDVPATPGRTFTISVFDDSGAKSADASSYVLVTPVNDPPVFSTVSGTAFTGIEDTPQTLTFASLLAASNASDPDGGPIQAFVVTEVSSGTLYILDRSTFELGLWNPGVYDTIDAGHSAYWTGAANANGLVDAFAVVAVDSTGLSNATPVQVPFTITPVNDPPTLTDFAGAFSGRANAVNPVTLADLLANCNEADVDGFVNHFVVTAVAVGTLRIGTSLVNSTPWSASTPTSTGNDIVDATHLAFWTPPVDQSGLIAPFSIAAIDNDGARSTTTVAVKITVSPPATMTAMDGPVSTVNEDTQTLITWQSLVIHGDEQAFLPEIIPTFIVKGFMNGTLLIRNSSGSVAPWAPDSNDVIDANHSGYWTPDENVNGVLGALTVVAQDSVGSRSSTPVPVQVSVTPVNDRPTLTEIAAPVATTNEDQGTYLSAANLAALSHATDVDGTVTAFVVTSVSSGTLIISHLTGSSLGDLGLVSEPWAPGTNDVIDGAHFAQWTPAPNANGVLNAIRVVAVDDGGLQSVTPRAVQVAVTPVNDAPTLTSFSASVDSTLAGTMVQVTFAELMAKGNEADVDGNVAGFLVKSSAANVGTLRIGPTLATAELWTAGSNDLIDLNHIAFWTPAAGAAGLQPAFAAVAVDNLGLASSTPVIVPITVLTVGTSPVGTTGSDTLIGGAGNDTLRGLAGNDLLTASNGDDVLDGGVGNDTLLGGEGSDLYMFLATDHLVAEINDTGLSGIDEVRFATTTTSTLKLYAGDVGIERIVIGTGIGASAVSTGTVAAGVNAASLLNAVSIIGNAGPNAIVGTSFDDTINGGPGADVMTGGNGNDTYYVDSTADKVVDSAVSGGIDLVYASASFTLSTNVENLILTGGAITGTGNISANTLTGNGNANVLSGIDGNDTLDGGDGNDTLIGGKGNDMLTGGSGADTFRFESSPSATSNKDFITDFTVGVDVLEFTASVFKALGLAGTLSADQFWSGDGVVSGHDASDRIVYDTTTGTLYYDADGSGRGASIAVAVMGDATHPALTAADIHII